MARGGARKGTPGRTYSNRSDLNAPKVEFTGQEYGQGVQQQAIQNAPQPQPFQPQSIPLDAPTQRQAEPVTAGLKSGPGPGPEVLGTPDPHETLLEELKALYRVNPVPELYRMIVGMQSS
jgi:hypothetical protein